MTDQIRDLLISLASHMAYMQGQLEAFTDQSDPEDYYWYRESITLRQKVTDALAEGDGPAVPDGREPASVATQPSDEELLELMPQQMRDDLAAAARAMSGFDPDNIKAASVFRIILNRHVADHARAVLARWGRPAPVLDGEVCELVRKLREQAAAYNAYPGHSPLIEEWAQCFTRAADLLERLSPPQPVPVSERLPGLEDCDAEGRCWWSAPETNTKCAVWCFGPKYPPSMFGAISWLPHHALPVPSVEVVTATATNPLHLETNDPIM